MTPLETLIQLLKARGVEPVVAPNGGYVKWPANEATFMAFEHAGALSVCQLGSVTLSPKEAIRATLGPGTCELEINTSMTGVVCSKCNYMMPKGTNLLDVNYCPNCGRRIVKEDA